MRARILPTVALLLLLLVAGCNGEARVEQGCAARGGVWTRVNPLRGFLLHDGVVGADPCDLLLVGEQVGGGQSGVVLRSRDGGATVRVLARFPRALHLRALAASGRTLWVAGDTGQARGFLRRSGDGGRTWRAVSLPEQITDVQSVVAGPAWLWLAGSAGRAAVVLGRRAGRWRELARVPPAGGGFAYFRATASRGRAIAFAGTDGRRGLVFVSREDGRSLRRLSPTQLTAATALAVPSEASTLVAGYAGAPEAGNGALLAYVTRPGPARPRVTALRGVPADLDFDSPTHGWLAVARRGGSVILVTRDGGASWRATRLAGDVRPPPIVERLLVGRAKYALTDAGLYRLG